MPRLKRIGYTPHGGALDLMKLTRELLLSGGYAEVLFDGPSGTGKSRANMETIYAICEHCPNTRVLMGRKTRASMTETTLRTWEDLVLPKGHPALNGPGRANRRSYDFLNGSKVIVQGFDDIERIKSLEIDIAYVNEANELVLNDWEVLMTRLRGQAFAAKLAIADCNPDHPKHFLIQRAGTDVMHRIVSRHKDNPILWDEQEGEWTNFGKQYMEILQNLSGVRRRRLYDGEWCAAEGQIYQEWDSGIHWIPASKVPGYNPDCDPEESCWDFDWTFCTVDWGTRAPTVMQGWGVDKEKKIYRVAEIYRTGELIEWWCDRAAELFKELDPVAFVCDTDRPDFIEAMNDRLTPYRGRNLDAIARAVRKRKIGEKSWLLGGIDLTRQLMHDKKIFLVQGAQRHRDLELERQKKPTCTEDEIPGYVWMNSIEGKPIKEKPDPLSIEHGCFPAGTLVAMADGSEKAIEAVEPGEMVMTPNGPEMVVDAAQTGVRSVVTIEHERGFLRCTPDHPIFCQGDGFRRADELRSTMTLCHTAMSSTTGVLGTDTPRPGTGETCTTPPQLAASGSGSTGISGSNTTAQFCRADKSITSMATARITESRILSVLRPQSMGVGIGYTQRGSWSSGRPCGETTSGAESASGVTLLSPSKSTARPSTVRPRASSGHTGGATDPVPVFNLTVEPSHVYYADGVLVSNCDAMRFAATFAWSHDYGVDDIKDMPVTLLSPVDILFDWDEVFGDD